MDITELTRMGGHDTAIRVGNPDGWARHAIEICVKGTCCRLFSEGPIGCDFGQCCGMRREQMMICS